MTRTSRILNPTTPGGLLTTIQGLLTAGQTLVVQAITSGTYFHINETPTGTMNGVNTSFTLSAIPNPATSLEVYLNGTKLKLASGYTLVGSALTMINIPIAGDEFLVNFTVSPV